MSNNEFEKTLGENVVDVQDVGGGKKAITLQIDTGDLPKAHIQKAIGSEGSIVERFTGQMSVIDYRNNFSSSLLPKAIKLPQEPHAQIALAREIYFNEPIVRTAIDLMVDFSISGFENECDDDKIKKFYDEWCRKVQMDEVLRWIFLEYYRSANVTVYKSMKNPKKKGRPSLKAKKNNELKDRTYPAGYTVLNPLYVWVEGPLLFNQEVIAVRLPQDAQNYVINQEFNNKLIENLPSEIEKAFKSGGQRILLDQDLVSRITRKRQPYERYAVPFTMAIADSVIIKEKLKMMDLSTLEGMINQLVTVTIGNDEYPADDEQLKAIAELFNTPNKAYVLFWNHTLEVKFHRPEGLETLTKDKYEEVNQDILSGLGISRVLIDGSAQKGAGSGGSGGSSWVSILALIERLENGREQVKKWLLNEYRLIAEENGFDTYPTPRFDKMNLRQDTTIKNILLAMYDRGLLSKETLLTETNYDFDVELSRKKAEKKENELFLPPNLPFSGNGTPPVNGKTSQTMPNEGRPSGTSDNTYPSGRQTIDKGGDKPPKAKASVDDFKQATAAYRDELEDKYDLLKSSISDVVSSEEEDKERKIKDMLDAFLVSMLTIGEFHILNTFDEEYGQFHPNKNFNFVTSKKSQLRNWHEGYVDKFVNDLRESALNNINDTEFVLNRFNAEQYRIKLFAQEGTRNGFLQGLIAGNMAQGATRATWVTAGDNKVCLICAGLHGRTYAIEDIPIIPAHPNCRCTLSFD